MTQNQTTSSIGIELPYRPGYMARDTLRLVLYLGFNVALLLSIGAATVYASEVLALGGSGTTVFVWAFGVITAVASFSVARRRFSRLIERIKVESDARTKPKNHY